MFNTVESKRRRCIIIIYTDADACPVKQEIDNIALMHQLQSYFVSTYAHVSQNSYYSHNIILDSEAEAVDLYIFNHVKADDIIVTQDNGLAAMVLEKGAVAINPRGKTYNKNDIDILLLGRYEGIQAKRGKTRIKGPPSLKKEDRERFVESLTKLL
ncbi:DUF188 domain-containing protein [Salibacterium salarium]|uniref:DUF188 domain-containing protein n=1 Tax=Salibacterium salarium TaxID=284579 RepID=A0A428N7Y8_9BACI|nr:DUF188 domain-containing protein [Salibacterium salarium]